MTAVYKRWRDNFTFIHRGRRPAPGRETVKLVHTVWSTAATTTQCRGEWGNKGQHNKEAPYEERAALLVCDWRAIVCMRRTIFVWKWRWMGFCVGWPCACQVLQTAMCDCVALTDMRITGLLTALSVKELRSPERGPSSDWCIKLWIILFVQNSWGMFKEHLNKNKPIT